MTRKFKQPWNTNACTRGRRRKGRACSERLGSLLLVSKTDLLETPRKFLARFNKRSTRKIEEHTTQKPFVKDNVELHHFR